jgi:hypothetical protein
LAEALRAVVGELFVVPFAFLTSNKRVRSGYAPGSLSPSFPFTVFTPHPSQAGTRVTLSWTSVNPAACPAAVVNITIDVSAAAFVSAGLPIDVCSSTPTAVQLKGSLSGTAIAGIWQGFVPGAISNSSDPNARFIPAPSQLGSVVNLTFTNTDAGICALAPVSTVSVNLQVPPCLIANSAFTGTVLSSGGLAGIVVGAVVGVAVAITCAILVFKYWNASKARMHEGDFDTSYQLMESKNYKF